MSNSYFRFKQFTVHQDRSAMKVCTDSCILGAWTTNHIHNAKKILDIGAGTGLLSLMLAQKSDGQIDAIELDKESAAQAKENINASPWSGRIHLWEGNVLDYPLPTDYDFMICNPPFYESDLRSPSEKNNRAKHDEDLSLDVLVPVMQDHLKITGRMAILLPYHRQNHFENLATKNSFFLLDQLTVRQTPSHQPFRSICLFGLKKPETVSRKELIIREDSGIYSRDFALLMEAFYNC